MKRAWGDAIIAGCALVVSAVVFFALPIDVPGTGLHTLADMGSAAFFPMLAALLIGVSAIGLAISTYSKGDDAEAGRIEPIGFRPLLMLAGFVAYIPLIHWLGMVTASAVMLCILPAVFGFRNFRWILPLAVLLPPAVYLLFERVLKVQFPHGAVF